MAGKTSIIIVTHNLLELTKSCLESIRQHTPEPIEIVVVDNGSTDGTLDYLQAEPGIRLIGNKENLGFPKACNQGIHESDGDYILLLSNDTVVTPNWLRSMIRVMEQDKRIAMVGPTSNRVSGEQQIPVTYSDLSGLDDFAVLHGQTYEGQSRPVRRLVGFCLLIRRSLLEEIGTLDERFGFGNYEDDDLCLRAQQAGYILHIALDSFVHHVGHATFHAMGDMALGSMLQLNAQKAKEKWGAPILDLLYKEDVTISLCMIVKNEENTIGRCLNSVLGLVDEIVIVDTGSTDRTKEIARTFDAVIYDFEWVDDFAAARNYAFAKATKNYIFWLDADDVILPDDRAKFIRLKESLEPDVDSVTMSYHLSFDEDGNVTSSLRRNRLVKKSRNFRWHGAVHEYLAVGGKIIDSPVAVTRRVIAQTAA